MTTTSMTASLADLCNATGTARQSQAIDEELPQLTQVYSLAFYHHLHTVLRLYITDIQR